jgi:hypothetical protein
LQNRACGFSAWLDNVDLIKSMMDERWDVHGLIFVINDDLVFKIITICNFLPNPTSNPVPCPNLIPYFWLSIKSSNLGMKSENWGPFIKIKYEIKI